MKTTNQKRISTETLVSGAVLTAIVIILQTMGSFALFGPFSAAVALIPIVIGAALCGVKIGAWLGFVFSMVVIFSGGATLFFGFHITGTIVTVVAKGVCCGLAAGFVYKLLKKINQYVAVIAAALTAPLVNTGVFLLGCLVFFMEDAVAIGAVVGIEKAGFAVFIALAFANFLFEIGINLVLVPVIVRVLNIIKKKK